MTTELIIILIFCYVDDRMRDGVNASQATLYPSEIVTIGILLSVNRVKTPAL